MAETRDQVLSMLRACLLSSKGGVPIGNVDRDYRILVGSRIPYQKMGYQSLEQFLSSVPDLHVSRDRTGEVTLQVIPNKNTEHLAAMVSKQKSVQKKHKFSIRNFPPRRTAAASWRPPPIPSASLRLSRRSPPASTRMPLSVTVSNRQESAKGSNFEKPSRMVSFGNADQNSMPQSALQSNNVGVGGKCGKAYQTFEKPPRFLRLSQDNSAPLPNPAPVPVSIPVSVPPSIPSSTMSSTSSKAQDRLVQAIASSERIAKNKNLTLNLTDAKELANKPFDTTNEIKSPGERTITSPLTPLQARLNAATRKPLQVHTLQPVKEKFSTLTLGTAGGGEDYIKRLEEFAESKGMGEPSFKAMPRMSEVGTFYSCYVKIDEFRFSSYPDERSSPAEAMQLTAKQALEELNKLNIGLGGGSATQDKNLIMSRISNIVGEHRSGIWSTQIPIDYRTHYNESLPDDWLNIMNRCPLVTLEGAAGNRIIVSPNWPAESSNVPVTSSSTSFESAQGRPLLSPIGPAVPEPIRLPESDAWDIFITCGNSTDEVWGRLIGEEYSVSYENLATDMEMFYMSNVNIATNPEVGSFYAIKMDDCWHRIELLEIDYSGTGEGRVFFIDHGDEEEVSLKELHVLERRFARLPAQAVHCFLWGLEEFADDPKAAPHITDTIVGRTLIASVKSRPKPPDSPGVGVVLYDTSTEDDLNMNGLLLENITKDTIEAQLPAEGLVQEMYISHVTNTGDVFLQFESYSYLQLLVSNMVDSGIKEDFIASPSKCTNPDPSRLYLARYLRDGNWYRAAIINKLPGRSEVEVMFVDFGNTEIINPTDLVVLDDTKSSLAILPRQAIKVHLHNVPGSSFNEQMAARVRELAPCDVRVLVKTVALASIPVVEVYKRIQPDNLLVSISETVLADVRSKSADDSSNFRGKKRLERLHSQTDDAVPSRGLSPPQIPDIGEYFDVHVTMAANPGNFTVQPYKDATRLEKMMEDMQQHYKVPKVPSLDNICEGGLYAALHNDNHWYRVCVSSVINGNMVSVYFCDYGDVSVLPVDKLQPLMNNFKNLPYQAIKAKLAGIQPKHSDWSVEDCLMFQEIVVEKQFVSVIMETGPDLLNPSDTVVGLKLIDTSGDEDVYIDQLLVSQDRAIDIFG